jgi:hypothetical protein
MREVGYAMPIAKFIAAGSAIPNPADQVHTEIELHSQAVPTQSAQTETVRPIGTLSGGKRMSRKPTDHWHPHKSLREKRLLMRSRVRTCDYSVVAAAIGILLTVLETEFTDANRIEKVSQYTTKLEYVNMFRTRQLRSQSSVWPWYQHASSFISSFITT